MGRINCFSLSTTWFKKRRAVENPVTHVRVDDDPNLTLVGNQTLDHPLDNDTLQDLTLLDNHNLDCPAVNNPVPDLTSVNNLTLDSIAVHIPGVVMKKNLLDLPDDIIIDMLIRLPTECVLQCQRASKLLAILAKNPFFIRKHLSQAPSIIAVQSFTQSNDRDIKFYFIDEQAKKVEEATLKLDFCYMDKEYPVMLYNSYEGFLLFKNKYSSRRSIFVIWNPITEEQVTITMEGLSFQVCGFYFNPHNKKYEVLLQYWECKTATYAYDILTFGSKLRRNIGRYAYIPRSETPPTIINGTLYWMVDKVLSKGEVNCSNSIMTFEIGTNKFSTIQHGGASCEEGINFMNSGLKHYYMHLIEIKGQLGLCVLLSYTSTELVLWVLNPSTNSWAKAHTVALPEYTMPEYISCWPNDELLVAEGLEIKDGKLLCRQKNRLLLWDLDLNTHKILGKKGFENDNTRSVTHTPSLVFLDTVKLIQLYHDL